MIPSLLAFILNKAIIVKTNLFFSNLMKFSVIIKIKIQIMKVLQ